MFTYDVHKVLIVRGLYYIFKKNPNTPLNILTTNSADPDGMPRTFVLLSSGSALFVEVPGFEF